MVHLSTAGALDSTKQEHSCADERGTEERCCHSHPVTVTAITASGLAQDFEIRLKR